MAFENEYDFSQLVNEAEQLVIKELGAQLGERNAQEDGSPVCVCEDCVLDMATLALNSVKPLYRVSLLGSLYAAHAMDEDEYSSALKKAVSNAIDKIHANPSHD